MRTTACLALVLSLSLPLELAAAHLPSGPRSAHAPGEVLVALAPNSGTITTRNGVARAASSSMTAMLERLGLIRAENLRGSTSPGQRQVEVVRLVSDQPGFDPEAAARALRSQPGVIGAAPNLYLHLDLAPNDPGLSSQWYLGNSAAAVHAQQGWARETGRPGVIIAIIDTGVDLGHEDLAGNIWTNPGEIPGNGIDDDHNGFIDDVHGWDFGDADNDPDPVPLIDPTVGIDEGWHGTFVAGIAAAVTNNGVGIAGLAWNCRILPLKVSTTAGDIPLSAVVSAFDYAIAQHASVLNLSIGATDTSAASLFQPLINEAYNANIVCVAAAGNDGTDTPNYPAACESVLAVASTSASNVRSSWSNWGWYVDMCAPGEGMWSSIARNYVYDDTSQLFFELLWGWDGVSPYMQGDGTSFATPVVSGAAALVRSHSPTMSASEVMSDLISSGDVKAYDNAIGPKLNLDRALANSLAVGPDAVAGAGLSLGSSPNPASRIALLRFALASGGRTRLAIVDAAGRLVRTLAEGESAAGEHSRTWDLRDAGGMAVPPGLYFARLEVGGDRLMRKLAVVR
jgi:subtilisin family serine protease